MVKDRRPFWDKIERRGAEECWPWTGYVVKGRPLTTLEYVSMYASRKAWILTHGPIRTEDCVNHRCDNALCCNPAHLYLGTRADNMIDRWRQPEAAERMATGRRTVLTAEELEQLWKMRAAGTLLRECAEVFGVHIATICRYITKIRKEKSGRLRQAVAVRIANV